MGTRPTFAEPTRLKQLALDERDGFVGSLRAWWSGTKQQSAEDRPFRLLPPAVVLLEFYRSQVTRLLSLEQAEQEGERLDFEQKHELKRLRKSLREPEPTFSVLSLLESWSDAELISDDPIWEKYKKYAKAPSAEGIPDSWFGPGEAGKQMKAAAIAREKERAAKK